MSFKGILGDSVGWLLSLGGGSPRQRGLLAVAIATAWDGCCCRIVAARDSVGTLLLSVPKINPLARPGKPDIR